MSVKRIMVDYKSIQTVTTTPGIIVKIQILELRSYVGDAIEAYLKVNERSPNMNPDLSVIRSRLYHYYTEVAAHYSRTEGRDKAEAIRNGILMSQSFEELDAIYALINVYLDSKRLTRFDTKKDIDPTDVEAENEEAES